MPYLNPDYVARATYLLHSPPFLSSSQVGSFSAEHTSALEGDLSGI
jgi:hypothetical protein